MIVTCGGRFAGYGFYLLKGKPVWTWNLFDLERVRWEGPETLSPGKHTLEFDFKYDGLGCGTLAFNNVSGIGRGGTGALRWTAKKSPRGKWSEPFPSSSSSMNPSISAQIPSHQWMTMITRCRSI